MGKFKHAFGFLALGLSIFRVGSSAVAADATLIEAAKKEGQVVWYTGFTVEQLARPMAEAFEAKYGIKVNYVRANASEGILRILEERKAGRVMVDVFDGALGAPALKKENALEAFRPDSASHYPKELVDADKFWTGLNIYVLMPAINTDLVPKGGEPRTWEDLLDPKWRGKLAWSNSMSAAGAPGFIATVLKEYGEEKGMKYLRQLATQNVASIDGSGRAATDQVVAGEYAIGLHIFNNQPATLARAGAPVVSIPISPATATLNTVSLIAKSPHPNAGRLFMDYLLSSEGQRLVAARDFVPADPNTPPADPALRPDGVKQRVLYLAPEEIAAGVARWGEIYRTVFR